MERDSRPVSAKRLTRSHQTLLGEKGVVLIDIVGTSLLGRKGKMIDSWRNQETVVVVLVRMAKV